MIKVLGLVLIVLSLVLHEAGHAVAMVRRGVTIKEAGLGLPLPDRLSLLWQPKFLPFPIRITPIPLLAYVEPTEEGNQQIKQMSYKDQASCYAAGVTVNLLFAFGLLAGVVLYKGNFGLLTYYLAMIVVVVLLRRIIAMAMPLISLIVTVLVVDALIASHENVMGPVGIVQVVSDTNGWTEVFVRAAVVSAGFGMFNALPLLPLDGGRVTYSLLQMLKLRTVSRVFMPVTACIFAVFVVFILVNDFL